jgi:predicted outer membrane repeat protein
MRFGEIGQWFLGFLLLVVAGSASAAISVGPDCAETDLRKIAADIHGDDARIFVESNYVGGWIQIDDKIVHIFGGMANCDQVTLDKSGTRSSLVSQPGDVHALVGISGHASVELRNFSLQGGTNRGQNGGGISFTSGGDKGHLELRHVDISSSVADRGGGIYFAGKSGHDDLVLADTFISGNFAFKSGGGMRLEGDVKMTMDELSSIQANAVNTCETDDSTICAPNNIGDGRGGGLQILDTATATISGDILLNKSRYGGGIAMHDSSRVTFGPAFLTPTNTSIFGNTATHAGGGIFLAPKDARSPDFEAKSISITANTAANGGAIYSDVDSGGISNRTEGGFINIDVSDDCFFPCSNQISGNSTTQPGGASIVVQDTGIIRVKRTQIRNNLSDIVLQAFDGAEVHVFNDVIAGNQGRVGQNSLQSVFDFSSDDFITTEISFTTIADNALSSTASVFTGLMTDLTLRGLLIWQPQRHTFQQPPTNTTSLSDTLTQDFKALDGSHFKVFTNVHEVKEPGFLNGSGSDYHLLVTSPAVDYALQSNTVIDLDGRERGKALVRDSRFDVGAYELQLFCPGFNDSIFCDQFDFLRGVVQ